MTVSAEQLQQITSGASPASREAEANWNANLRAIKEIQPDLATTVASYGCFGSWVYARDASLTTIDAQGRWWGKCSVPRLAAQAMLREMDPSGQVACFLAPDQAPQLRIALDLKHSSQSLIVIAPDTAHLSIILRQADFSADLRGHRLLFATGSDWPIRLEQLLREFPGLCIPSQFIRLPSLTEAQVNDMIGPAQRIFGDENAARARRVESIRLERPEIQPGRICLAAPLRFRLWDDAGFVLSEVLRGRDLSILDVDDPLHQSSLGLALATQGCEAILCPDLYRADMPGVLHDAIRWVTWLTQPRVVARSRTGLNDRLLVADQSWLEWGYTAGWKMSDVTFAPWPVFPGPAPRSGVPGALTIIADTRKVNLAYDTNFSSHRVLWERILREIQDDPFVVPEEPNAYLTSRMQKLEIADDGLNRLEFITRLIQPLYEQGLARLILQAGLPLKIYGQGWSQIDEFKPHSAGVVSTRPQLQAVVASASALVHVWPSPHRHAIDACARPVVRRNAKQRGWFVRDARTILAGKYTGTPSTDANSLRQAIDRFAPPTGIPH